MDLNTYLDKYRLDECEERPIHELWGFFFLKGCRADLWQS
jgi:hypothetical protein